MWALDASTPGSFILNVFKKRRLSESISHTESIVQQQQEKIERLEALNSELVKHNAKLNAELEAMKQPQIGGLVAIDAGQVSQAGQACPKHKKRKCFAMTPLVEEAAQMWSMPFGMSPHTFNGDADAPRSWCLSPDSTQLFTTHQDGTARMWDLSTGRCLRTYAGQLGEPTGVCVTLDMKYLITATDMVVNVWQVESGLFIKSLPHQGCVRCFCMAPDGEHFFSVDNGGFGRKFVIPGFEQVCLFDGKDSLGLYACCLSGDGKRFFAASNCGSVKMFDADLGGGPLLCLEGPGKASRIMTSPTAPLLFCGRDDAGGGVVQVFSTQTGKLQRTIRGHSCGVSAMWVTPDGRWLLTASWDKTAKVWDISTGTAFLTLHAHASHA